MTPWRWLVRVLRPRDVVVPPGAPTTTRPDPWVSEKRPRPDPWRRAK